MPTFTPIEPIEQRPRFTPVDEQPTSTAIQAFSREALERLISNITGLPSLAATAGMRILANQPLIDREVSFPGVDPETAARMNEPLLRLPKVGERVIPLPTGEQTIAGASTAMQAPGALIRGEPVNLGERFRASMAAGERAEQEHPTATTFGGLFGEGLTLATGRLPGVRAATRLAPTASRSERLARLPQAIRSPEPGLRRALDDAVNTQGFQRLLRGAGRAGETSFEAATLSALSGDDPVEGAMFGASQQIGGSIALETFRQIRRHPIIASVGTAAAVLQILKQSTPGGRDLILESIEGGFDKILIASALGLTAGLAGSGRIRGSRRAQDFPLFADAVTAVPRGAVMSLLRDWLGSDESEQETIEQTLAHWTATPDAFTARQRRQLEHSLRHGGFSRVVNRLARDEGFTRIIDAPVGLGNVPLREESE